MNLYKVLFRHVTPKDIAESILGYLLAENDEQVYEQVKEKAYWDDDDEIESWDHEKDEEIILTKKEHMINLKGDYFDEDSDYSDAYYGISQHGWELVQENISEEDIQVLKKLNILTLEN